MKLEPKKIIDKARRIADLTGSEFISSEEDVDYLNEALRGVWETIVGTASDWPKVSKKYSISELTYIDEGNSSYYLITPPEDFARLRRLSCFNGNRRVLIPQAPRVVPREKPHTGAAAREQPRDSPVIER